ATDAALTEADLQKLGSGIDPKKGAPQIRWDEEGVNTGSTRGKISDEQRAKNGELAQQIVSGDGQKQELSPADLAALAKQAGVPLEKLDPNQLLMATKYANQAGDGPAQAESVRKVLDNFQALSSGSAP